MKTLINLYGLEGKFLTVGKQYTLINGVSAWFVRDNWGDIVEVNLSNFE